MLQNERAQWSQGAARHFHTPERWCQYDKQNYELKVFHRHLPNDNGVSESSCLSKTEKKMSQDSEEKSLESEANKKKFLEKKKKSSNVIISGLNANDCIKMHWRNTNMCTLEENPFKLYRKAAESNKNTEDHHLKNCTCNLESSNPSLLTPCAQGSGLSLVCQSLPTRTWLWLLNF